MKKLFTLFAMLIVAFSINAYDVVINDMCFDLNKDTKTATFVQDESYKYQYLGDIVIPETIEVDGIEYTVTAIGEYAFFYTKGLTSVSIPETVETIGTYAFSYSIIEEVRLPSKIKVLEPYVFSDCNDLKVITLPEGLETIKEGAFYACKLLETITLPSTLTAIEGEYTFSMCTSLAEIHANMATPFAYEKQIMFGDNIYEYATLYVPEGSKEAYLATDFWNNFKNIEEEVVSTSIENAVAEKINDNTVYDLQGRRVNDNFKGIVIKNGKKFIMK